MKTLFFFKLNHSLKLAGFPVVAVMTLGYHFLGCGSVYTLQRSCTYALVLEEPFFWYEKLAACWSETSFSRPLRHMLEV